MDWKYLLTSFDGRINRAKFWAAIAVFIGAAIVASIIDALLGTYTLLASGGLGLIGAIVSLVSFFFALAVYAKRWHDRGKSGWWTLIGLVPIIGVIWMVVELGILEGSRGVNRYGPDPLA